MLIILRSNLICIHTLNSDNLNYMLSEFILNILFRMIEFMEY